MDTIYEKWTAIGNAIRYKTGGTELLSLDEMAAEINGINVSECMLTVVAKPNASVTITDGENTFSKIADVNGNAVFKNMSDGVWTITGELNGATATNTIIINTAFSSQLSLTIYLYSKGITNTDLCGGLETHYADSSGGRSPLSITYNTDNIKLMIPGNASVYTALGTSRPVNLSAYDNISFVVSQIDGSFDFNIGISDNKVSEFYVASSYNHIYPFFTKSMHVDGNGVVGGTQAGVYSLDVSDISGEQYIVLLIDNHGKSHPLYATITDIYLN